MNRLVLPLSTIVAYSWSLQVGPWLYHWQTDHLRPALCHGMKLNDFSDDIDLDCDREFLILLTREAHCSSADNG